MPQLSPSYSSPCATHVGGAVGPPLLSLCTPGQVLVALNVFPPLPVSPDSSCFPSLLSLSIVSSCGRSSRPLPALPTVWDRHPLGVRQVSMLLPCTNLSPFHSRGQSHLSVVATLSQQSFSLLPNPWQSSPSSTGFLLGLLQEEQGQLSGSPCWPPNAVNSPFVLAGWTGGWGLHLCPSAHPCWSTHAAPSASLQQGTGRSPCSKQVDYSYFEDCLYCRTLL